MTGRAPNPNDPIKNQADMISPFACWVIADSVGFKGHDRVIAAAVAMAESSGNAHAIHINDNGTADYGLWQINSVHRDLFDQYDWTMPGDNGRMAYTVWQKAGGKWSPWATYPNAANLQMNKAVADIKSHGVSNPDSDSGSPYTASIADILTGAITQGVENSVPGVTQLEDISNFLTKISNPKSWASIGLVILGGILILIIAYKLLATDAIKAGEKVLNSPVGKAVRTVV